MSEIFIQLGIILVIAFLVSYIARLLKQPLIIGYILAGIIVSPFLISFGATNDVINIFSKIGIAFLLFIIGLHMNPKVIKEVGKQSLFIALAQMILTFLLTFLISSKLLNLDSMTSFYIGVAISFSSTIIVMKLISDRKQLDSLYGKLSTGILIAQDLVAAIVLMFISTLNDGLSFGALAIKTILIGGFLIFGLFLIGFFVLSRITRNIARSQELLFLFSISWCFLIAALFAFFGFSIEIGALIAGMVLSISPYSTEISSKIRPLRDFFLIIFFIILGLNIDILNIKDIIFNALILSVVVLILKPIILMAISAFFGYTKRTNFLVGISLSQISAFSLIILTLGLSLGHVSKEIVSTLTLTLIMTIVGSTYMMVYSKSIYRGLSSFISIFERKNIKKKRKVFKKKYEAILFGYNRTGFEILRSLTKLKKPYLVVDFNPDTIHVLNKFKIPCLYGDADDLELISDLNIDKTDLIISTIPDKDVNLLLIESVRLVNPDAVIIVRAREIDETFELYEKGADYVLTSTLLGGQHIANMINSFKSDKKRYNNERKIHMNRLKEILKKSKGRLRFSEDN